MSKFKIGERVSFLYFGDKKKGTILAHWPVDSKDTGTGLFRVTIDGSVDSQVCVAEKTMRKLKPKKPRREFWVVQIGETSRIAVDTEVEALAVSQTLGTDMVHVKEVL